MQIVYKKVESLTPYKNNPRINDGSVRAVANSIQEFGFKVPIVIDKNNVIIAGHTRHKAAKMIGLTEVPCIIADDLTDEQIKAFRIADNSVGSDSDWDIDLLKIETSDLPFDFTDFGLYLDDDINKDKGDGTGVDEKEIPKMELRAFEHYDYLVFVFDNQHDFLNMAQEFGIKKVDAGWVNRKLGIGRVVKGNELVKRIRNQDSDIEQGTLGYD